MDFTIRKGLKNDLPAVLELIRELAHYERAADEVVNTVEQMETDGFGEKPLFGFFVAEKEGSIKGMALYYYRYSTWKGKRLYLEDIIVTESSRGNGLGDRLFKAVADFALAEGCSGMSWQVLDWNEPAINFYKKYQAAFDGEWINCSLSAKQMRELVAQTNSEKV
jgi:GNAT superfamily N-acetyltransferase